MKWFGSALRPVYLQSASIKISFFFSASSDKGCSDAKYPLNAAAPKNAKPSAGSHGLPDHRALDSTRAEIPASTIWAPNIIHTETLEFRWLRMEPNSSLRGKLSEAQLAIGNCPLTVKTSAKMVATSVGIEGAPNAQAKTTPQRKTSNPIVAADTRFFPAKRSENLNGAVK